MNASRITVLACLAFAAASCTTVPKTDWPLPADVKVIAVNGYPIAYTERGSGTPLVFIHGAANDYRYWDPQLMSLSGRYRVVSVSLRHHYPERWGGKGDDFSLQVHAADIAGFIDALGAGPAVLVGHSRGGSVAAGAAKLRPDLVKKLVLAEPSLMLLVQASTNPAEGDARARRFGEMLDKDNERGLEIYADAINGPGSWKRRSEGERQIVRDNAWTLVAGLRDQDVLDCDDLRALRMPIMLVQGEKGVPGLHKVIAEARKCAPGAQHAVVPNAGHRMTRDNPAAFDAALVSFLER